VIDRGAPEVPWRQLAALLRSQIESGELAPGARVPSTNTLAQEYELSTSTVRKALRALKDDGLIIATPGYATFVRR
jgi:GntR family transcriptional regulator